MKIIELILDEESDISGVEAISVVEYPAIEEDFIALKDQQIKFAEVDADKRILMGALLVPNKPIFRKGDEEDYYVYFSKSTIKRASELYLQKGNQNNSTLEHAKKIEGLSLVESWIVEDKEKDKTALYNMELPLGSWVGAVKVENDEIWNDWVKTGKVKGFSIEGYFADKMERPKESLKKECEKCDGTCGQCENEEEMTAELMAEIKALLTDVELESYSDYGDGVSNNAKRGIDLNKKNNNKCATQVGKVRAQQLANKEAITVDTIKRMYSYLSRAEEYYDASDTSACGTISFLLWGGLSGLNWSRGKLKELGEIEADSEDIDLKEPCWKGYEQIGWKQKDGQRVPNCVPIKRK